MSCDSEGITDALGSMRATSERTASELLIGSRAERGFRVDFPARDP